MVKNKILHQDCIEGLKSIPDNSIDCIVTSPPYFGLRDYGTADQIGLEDTPELFVQKLVDVFSEGKRVLKDTGTLWLNLGDSYWGGKGQSGTQSPEEAGIRNKSGLAITSEHQQLGGKGYTRPTDKKHHEIKAKDLVGIPWMVAFALRSSGWYLRQDIIWAKPNPMPESVTDRCTKSHEYIFLLSKSNKYYYDHAAIMQDVKTSSVERLMQDVENQNGSTFDKGKTGEMMETRGGRKSGNKERKQGVDRGCPENTGSNVCGSVPWEGMKANKRSVWTVTTKPFKEAHFATFPEDLIVDCIKAGCPEGGIVLDPFMGAGTTALVARKLNRNFIGFELNPEYIKIAEVRLRNELGLFL
jgi:DNA modification methylase